VQGFQYDVHQIQAQPKLVHLQRCNTPSSGIPLMICTKVVMMMVSESKERYLTWSASVMIAVDGSEEKQTHAMHPLVHQGPVYQKTHQISQLEIKQ
jgi:hypothetical protein